jgi:hypothetical protein
MSFLNPTRSVPSIVLIFRALGVPSPQCVFQHPGRGAFADRRHSRAGWLLRDDGRLKADHGGSASIDERLDRLSRLNPDDREAIRTLSAEIRETLGEIASETAGKGAAARAYFSIGSPFADQSLKPPAIELTFLKPSRCSVCAARSERPPLAQ